MKTGLKSIALGPFIVFAAIAPLSVGCGPLRGKKSESAPLHSSLNPNRLSPGAYLQSSLSIPTLLNDQYHIAMSPWTGEGSPLPYLWGYDDVDVFPLYSSLKKPPQELIVAVIDSGVDKDHEDIAGRLWVNKAEYDEGKWDNGFDNDGDGFVNDYLGWDFVNNTNNPADDLGHGTHVAGTIASIGGNKLGIAGVAPWVRIMALKVCDRDRTCDTANIRAAISYAWRHGAKIINLSLGGVSGSAESIAFNKAIEEATRHGALVFVAAGNLSADVMPMAPANAAYAVTVAAHRSDGFICSFSNHGWKVDLSAPGCAIMHDEEVSGVLSLNSRKCGPLGNEDCPDAKSDDPPYALKSGTSMATPHAVGVAAVAMTADPAATPLQIRQALLRTARPVAQGAKDFLFGMGKASGFNFNAGLSLVEEARSAPGLKVSSQPFGLSPTSCSLALRLEARAYPLHWELRYQKVSSATTSLILERGTSLGQEGDVAANTAVDTVVNWTLPSSDDDYVVILEATANHQKYYDVTGLNR